MPYVGSTADFKETCVTEQLLKTQQKWQALHRAFRSLHHGTTPWFHPFWPNHGTSTTVFFRGIDGLRMEVWPIIPHCWLLKRLWNDHRCTVLDYSTKRCQKAKVESDILNLATLQPFNWGCFGPLMKWDIPLYKLITINFSWEWWCWTTNRIVEDGGFLWPFM